MAPTGTFEKRASGSGIRKQTFHVGADNVKLDEALKRGWELGEGGMGMWKGTGKIVRTPGKILVMPLPTVCVAPSLQTLPNIKIIDYLTHLEFRACSLMAQVLLPEKRNWIFSSWPGTLGHETALKEVLYLP